MENEDLLKLDVFEANFKGQDVRKYLLLKNGKRQKRKKGKK